MTKKKIISSKPNVTRSKIGKNKITFEEQNQRWGQVIAYIQMYYSLLDAEKLVEEHKKLNA